MFGAEAVSKFLVMVKNTFSVPGAQKPEHIFYDTNCDARQQAEKDPWFKDVGMCVHAWHFRNKMLLHILIANSTATRRYIPN
jgi:hypothetical protein